MACATFVVNSTKMPVLGIILKFLDFIMKLAVFCSVFLWKRCWQQRTLPWRRRVESMTGWVLSWAQRGLLSVERRGCSVKLLREFVQSTIGWCARRIQTMVIVLTPYWSTHCCVRNILAATTFGVGRTATHSVSRALKATKRLSSHHS